MQQIRIEAPHPRSVVAALGRLVGLPALPPAWALGYHQCRYSYTPDRQVLKIARGFREREIPCDVIWLDIDYMDGYRSFTFHPGPVFTQVLLADEPTGNLDTKSGEEIMILMSELHSQGSTIVMVTHDDDITAYAERIIRLRDGQIEIDQRNGALSMQKKAKEVEHAGQ